MCGFTLTQDRLSYLFMTYRQYTWIFSIKKCLKTNDYISPNLRLSVHGIRYYKYAVVFCIHIYIYLFYSLSLPVYCYEYIISMIVMELCCYQIGLHGRPPLLVKIYYRVKMSEIH